MAGRVFQLNIKPSTPGERGLPKRPVPSALVTTAGMEGDFNRWRHEKAEDNPDMALLIMALETLQELNGEGWPVEPGDIGENITTEGIPYDAFAPGRIYRVGEARVQISKRCDPCTNLYLLPYVGEQKGPRFLKVVKGRRGWYARVLSGGVVRRGDVVEEIPGRRG
jgi:MOSC domain-containing protein YiiM